MWHDVGNGALFLNTGGWVEPGRMNEVPETKRRLKNLLDVSGLTARMTVITPDPASEEAVLRLHTPAYLERLRSLSEAGGGDTGKSTPIGPGGLEIVLLAAGACIAATDAVLDGAVANAYALIRPPGHHAEAEMGRGGCVLANAALAALHARHARGLHRVAIVDWDVHHGNGYQDAFWEDPSVLTVSIHQDRAFPPDSGMLDEVGEGPGKGFNINIPLPPGSGTGAYDSAWERVVLPALRRFRPELILVASGFDASAFDPMGRQMIHSDGFRALTRGLLEVAAETADGRLVCCHEGGYSAGYVPFCGLAVIEELTGVRTEVTDPFLPVALEMAFQELQPHEAAVIDRVAAIHDLA
jgi:acetoin utilization deacetylase AcuC-like enzyme